MAMMKYKVGMKLTSIFWVAGLTVSLLTGCGAENATSKEAANVVEETQNEYSDASETEESADEKNVSESDEAETDKEIETGNQEDSEEETAEADDELTDTQRNSINMLNYLTVLTQEINDSRSSRVFLENAYSSLINNIYPNAVDTRTQAQLTSILDTLEGYRMITEKRERLEYIYEQNCAQAMRQAIPPDSVGLLSAVQSGNLLKAAASVVYMAVDSVSSYSTAIAQTDLQYLQDGWQLDDEEAAELHNSRKAAFAYMINMVRDNSLPGDYALNEEAVQQFVEWENNDNLVRRIAWLETNQETYKEFGSYWLVLGKSYYEDEEYEKCLEAIKEYNNVSSRIFRKDFDYAEALPMAIISARETCSEDEYILIAEQYTSEILENTNNENWTLRYYAAQIYLDLYAKSNERSYIEKAYQIAFDNVNNLVDEQTDLNAAYLSDVKEIKAEDGATKREKKEIKEYNKLLKAERKTALPPVSESVYLNCDLLFALADELDISADEQNKIETMIHENGAPLFLTTELDNKYWFSDTDKVEADDLTSEFDGENISIPATCVTGTSTITVTIKNGENETVIDDWTIKEVKRPKKADYTEYVAIFSSKTAKKYKYANDDIVQINIVPIKENEEDIISIQYKVKKQKKLKVIPTTSFERLTDS